MATVNVKADSHVLSVVSDRVYETTSTGRVSVKENWLKANILGAEGNVRVKFDLLSKSPLQFKVATSARVQDAKASDTYYPKGRECAQLFAILADLENYVDCSDFNGSKWEKRFASGTLACKRLFTFASIAREQLEETERQAKADADALAQASVVPTAEPIPENRMEESTVPTVETEAVPEPAPVTGRRSRKQTQPAA